MKEINEIMRNLAEYIRIQEQAAEQVEALKDQLKERMKAAGVETIQGDEHKAVYKAVFSNRLDTAALKKELPDVAKRYTVTTESMRFTFN
jgi:predicted phage-related endonuclease